VERYSNLEQIEVSPGDIVRVFGETIGWQQVFTLPQFPAAAVDRIGAETLAVLEPADLAALGVDLQRLIAEMKVLLVNCQHDRCVLYRFDVARQQLPTIMQIACGAPGRVNSGISTHSTPPVVTMIVSSFSMQAMEIASSCLAASRRPRQRPSS
jgi:hypothetical protein